MKGGISEKNHFIFDQVCVGEEKLMALFGVMLGGIPLLVMAILEQRSENKKKRLGQLTDSRDKKK